jgi:hypothetical protein
MAIMSGFIKIAKAPASGAAINPHVDISFWSGAAFYVIATACLVGKSRKLSNL